MLTITHMINPVKVEETSDLYLAQPITFETMRNAREYTREVGDIKVSLCATMYPEDREIIPGGFEITDELDRSVLDIGNFRIPRKLPLLKDILDRLYSSSKTGYLIYSNVDIALQPYFYMEVAGIIRKGYDAFVINRRTIPEKYSKLEEIPLMYAEVGQPHKGYDCFVFKREAYPAYKLGNMCIGAPWIGRVLLANMVTYSLKFMEFRDRHLTFHVGDSCTWRNEKLSDYLRHNKEEYFEIFKQLEATHGGWPPDWLSYLKEAGLRRQFPQFE